MCEVLFYICREVLFTGLRALQQNKLFCSCCSLSFARCHFIALNCTYRRVFSIIISNSCSNCKDQQLCTCCTLLAQLLQQLLISVWKVFRCRLRYNHVRQSICRLHTPTGMFSLAYERLSISFFELTIVFLT